MKRLLTSSFAGACACFLLGCNETAQQTICDGVQAGATEVLASLIVALFEIISGS
jgi:hypothetical protein